MKPLFCLSLLIGTSILHAVPVDFKLNKPDAEEVLVAGEFNNWTPIPMLRNESGEWHVQLDIEPGDYGYKFIADEVWLFDPNNSARREVDGVSNSWITVVDVPRQTQSVTETPAAAPAAPPVETEARDWKDSITGRTIVARLVDMEGNFAVLEMNGGLFRVRKERLRPSDQAYIAEWEANRPQEIVAASTDAPANTTASPFDATLTPEQMHIFTMPMGERMRYLFKPRGFDPSQTPEDMRIALALPKDFDPTSQDVYVAIVSCTADADASSVNHMKAYYDPVTKGGWVCIAIDIDGDEPKRREWNGMDDRWILVYSALQEMHKVWPASKRWEYSTFGYSGGAGYSNFIAAALVENHYDLHAIWAGGSNYQDYHFSEVLSPRRAFYRARYFLSWGRHDTIADAGSQEAVRNWGEENFRKFRYETFDGGHSIFQPHLEAAMIWFNE